MPLPKRRLPSLSTSHLWPLIVLGGIFAFVNTHPIRPHDFWWHIAVGREILDSGRIPLVDTYSFTAAGTPYPSYQIFWLAEIVMYTIYAWGGPALTVFAQSLFVTMAYALTLVLSHRISRDWRIAALATLFAAALGVDDWNVRPQSITFGLAPLFLLTMHAYHVKPRPMLLAIFPLGMVLWVNSHGSYVIGLVLIGLWLLSAAWTLLSQRSASVRHPWFRNLSGPLIALMAAALACLLNPRGLGIITYVRTLTTDPVVQSLVTEWRAPSFDTLHGGLFLVALLGLAAIMMLSPRRPTAFQLLTFLAFAALSLKTMRGIIWFGLVMAPVLTDHLVALRGHLAARGLRFSTTTSQSGLLNWGIVVLLLVSLVLTLPWFKSFLPMPPAKAGLISAETPIAATDFLLTARPSPPLFHAQAFGSYLIWAASPNYAVFVDSRIELYPAAVWLDYLAISSASCDWQQKLDDYDIQILMLDPLEQTELVQAAKDSTIWRQVYADATAVVFERAEVHK